MNLFIDPMSVLSGWVTVLASWQRSRHLALSLIATKSLANMDVDRQRVRQPYADSVFVYHPMFRGDGYDSALRVILITYHIPTIVFCVLVFYYAQSPLHKFPRNFPIDMEVASLLLATYHIIWICYGAPPQP